MSFWRFEEKIGQKISIFFRKFREFFKVEKLILVGDFEVYQKKLNKKWNFFHKIFWKKFEKVDHFSSRWFS